MDYAATQVYEEEDFDCTQRITQDFKEKELVQVGILTTNTAKYQIKSGTTKIGRLSSCDVVISDMTISKIHAEIEADADQGSTWICDLRSSNKTKLNNTILRPERLYELKDGNIIEFGKVCAVYRTCRPSTKDKVIPDTPALTRQNIGRTIIPNTPDSSINNSSTANSDGSVILGTQTETEKNVFLRPSLPDRRQSTSINEKKSPRGSSVNTSDDSQTDIRLRLSMNKSGSSEEENIFDMNTQKNPETDGKTATSISIHDMETQNIFAELPEGNVSSCVSDIPATSINDMKTQNYTNDKERPRADRGKTDISKVTAKKAGTNIYDLETQKFTIETAENTRDGGTAKKRVVSIHDLETQNYTDETAKSTQSTTIQEPMANICDLETQDYTGVAESNIGTRGDKNRARTAGTNQAEEDIHKLATQKSDDVRSSKNIYDMETQSESDGTINQSINDRGDKDNDVKNKDAPKAAKSRENATKLPSSRSSSPELLNLSSPEIDENCPSSPLNQSAHLLESSELLEYFGDGIDKSGEIPKYNTSTPKLKTSSQKSNAGSAAANSSHPKNDNEEDNIYDLPTQRSSGKTKTSSSDDSETENGSKKKSVAKRKALKKRPQLKQTNDDSETDAEEYLEELAKKQGGSKVPSKLCDENAGDGIDQGISTDSDDMFEMPTQQVKKDSSNNTSDSPISKPPKTDQVVVDDFTPTQLISPHKASQKTVVSTKYSSLENNQSDVDSMAPTQIINTKTDAPRADKRGTSANYDSENIDYETAITQVISDVAKKETPTKRTSDHEKGAGSSKVDLNDTLERDLNEMFIDVDGGSVQVQHQLMSTQCLEDILQSSQSNETLPSKVDGGNAPQTKSKKKSDRLLLNATDSAAGQDNANINDSQNSDSYFSTITTKRKKNIMRDTQEFIDSVENLLSSCSTSTLPQKSKEETKSSTTRSNKNNDKTSVQKSKMTRQKDAAKTDVTTSLSDNDAVNKTTSNKENKRVIEKSKTVKQKQDRVESKSNVTKDRSNDAAVMKSSSEDNEKVLQKGRESRRKRGAASKTNVENERVLEEDSRKGKVDHAEENSANGPDVCAPCPSESGQDAQTLYDSDDDILKRLPAVRISGTLSYPGSPSASSTSTVRSTKSKQSVTKGGKRNGLLKNKSLRGKPGHTNKSPLSSHDNYFSGAGPENLTTNQTSKIKNDSDDSDSGSNFKRFKQMADRMLKNDMKKGDKGSVETTNKSGKKRDSSVCKDSKQNFDSERSENPTRTSTRATRYAKRQDKESIQPTKEARAKDTTDKSTKSETKSTAARNKRNFNTIVESPEETSSKKPKIDPVVQERPVSRRISAKAAAVKQSPNVHQDLAKINSRENSPVLRGRSSSENVKAASKTRSTSLVSKTNENIATKSSVTRNRRKMKDSPIASSVNEPIMDENKDKQTQAKKISPQSQDKTLKVMLHPIVIENGSQEVEMIMKNAQNDPQENTSIKAGRSIEMLQPSSRNTRSRKRANANTTSDSSLIISNTSSDTSDLETVKSGSIASTKAKRNRSAKNSVPPVQELLKQNNDVFKKPVRVSRHSAASTASVTAESAASDDSRNSMEMDVSLNIRLSRSKVAGMNDTWKIDSNENKRRKRTTSVDTSVDTPTRMTRRSTSSMSISSPLAAKYRILFTGIMDEQYNKVIKTLGGSKVDAPEKCSILVTDKVRRTYKFLCAVARGVPIVSLDWLHDSESAKEFLDWENYLLKDPAAEAKFGFRLRKSLDRAKEKGLLIGYTIVLTPNIAPPPPEELSDMITSCGGRVLLRPPATWPGKTIIISRNEDLANARKYLAKAPKTVTAHSIEFILTGILRQEVDLDKYRLM